MQRPIPMQGRPTRPPVARHLRERVDEALRLMRWIVAATSMVRTPRPGRPSPVAHGNGDRDGRGLERRSGPGLPLPDSRRDQPDDERECLRQARTAFERDFHTEVRRGGHDAAEHLGDPEVSLDLAGWHTGPLRGRDRHRCDGIRLSDETIIAHAASAAQRSRACTSGSDDASAPRTWARAVHSRVIRGCVSRRAAPGPLRRVGLAARMGSWLRLE
jgi:hypothetical protein